MDNKSKTQNYDIHFQADECMLARPHKVKGREAIVRRAMDKQESHEMASCTKIFLGAPGGKNCHV